MKIIVSTKALYKYLNRALLIGCQEIIIIEKRMVFCCNDERLGLGIELLEETNLIGSYNPNPTQMYKLMVFIEQLQEQPIVVEFNQFSKQDCMISLSGFEHRF